MLVVASRAVSRKRVRVESCLMMKAKMMRCHLLVEGFVLAEDLATSDEGRYTVAERKKMQLTFNFWKLYYSFLKK